MAPPASSRTGRRGRRARRGRTGQRRGEPEGRGGSSRSASPRVSVDARGWCLSVADRVGAQAVVVGSSEGDFQVVCLPLRGEIRGPRRTSSLVRFPSAGRVSRAARGRGRMCQRLRSSGRGLAGPVRARAVRSPRHPNVLFWVWSRAFSLLKPRRTWSHPDLCASRADDVVRIVLSDRCGRRSVGSAGGASRAGACDCAQENLPGPRLIGKSV